MTFEQIRVVYNTMFHYRSALNEASITYRYSPRDNQNRFHITLRITNGPGGGNDLAFGLGNTVEEAVQDALESLTRDFNNWDELEIKGFLKALKCL